MQLLIVHDDAEVGEQLAGMVADYTEHGCEFVANDLTAQEWAQKHARCDLLLARLDGAGVDGETDVESTAAEPPAPPKKNRGLFSALRR